MPFAARLADPTTHGSPLAPGPGSTNVMIGGQPAWRAEIDQHACPAVSITGADGVGAVMMGSPTVLINGQMACRMGDIVVEKPGLALGPANPIIMGCPTVQIGEVGMGGASSPIAASAAAASSAAVATHSSSSSSSSSSGSSSSPAPAKKSLAPPPAPQALAAPPAKKKPPVHKDKQIVCGITAESLQVACQHGRKPKNGLLEVVGSVGGGDTISASCGIIGTCGQHPDWEVGGYWTTKKIGTQLSFNTRDFEALPAAASVLPVWLGDIAPHAYNVSVSACSGPDYAFIINAYPNDLQQIKFSTEVYEKKFEKLHDWAKELLEKVVEHPVLELPKASGSCQLQWKEAEKSNLAFYYWQLTLALDPLISIGARFPLGPQAALPAAVRKYVNAGFFAEIKGELALSVNGGQLNPPESEKGHFSGKGEGAIYLTVGGSAFIGGDGEDSPFKVEMALQTSFGIEVVCQMEGHEPVVDVEASVGGLRGYATLVYHVGWDGEKKYEVNLFDKKTFPKTFHPFAKKGESTSAE